MAVYGRQLKNCRLRDKEPNATGKPLASGI